MRVVRTSLRSEIDPRIPRRGQHRLLRRRPGAVRPGQRRRVLAAGPVIRRERRTWCTRTRCRPICLPLSRDGSPDARSCFTCGRSCAPGPGRRVLNLAARGADILVAISRATGAAVRTAGWSWSSTRSSRRPRAPGRRLGAGRPVVGFLGRLDPPKGIEDLLRAAGDLPAQFVVVGSPWAGDETYVVACALGEVPARPACISGRAARPVDRVGGHGCPRRPQPDGAVRPGGRRGPASLAYPWSPPTRAGCPTRSPTGSTGCCFPSGTSLRSLAASRPCLDEPELRARLVAAGLESGQRFRPSQHAARIAALYAGLVDE